MISFFLIVGTGQQGKIIFKINIIAVIPIGFPGNFFFKIGRKAGIKQLFLFPGDKAEGKGSLLGFGILQNIFNCSFEPV